jgi:hypothetical protein
MLRKRNAVDAEIAVVIGRPMTHGHLGEWIASEIFDIELEPAANAEAIDGHFRTGALAGATVNVKWYLKREGILDMSVSDLLDYYLVLSGPVRSAPAAVLGLRPWRIDAVYLLDARALHADLIDRGRRVGVASSVRSSVWDEAEIFPRPTNPALSLTTEQRAALRGFALG